MYVHQLWSTPLLVIAAFFILLYMAGIIPTICGLGVIVLAIPIQSVISSVLHRSQRAIMARKDRRTKLLSEALRAILAIKLFSWEENVSKRINSVRNEEIAIMKRNIIIQASASFVLIFFFISPIKICIAVGSCADTSGHVVVYFLYITWIPCYC